MRALGIILLLIGSVELNAAEPFDVSLSYSPSADLSDYYRALVHNATERYRGDGGSFAVERVYITGYFRRNETEIEYVIGDPTADHVYVFSRSSAGHRTLLAEAHVLLDPFPAKPFNLRTAVQDFTSASNQTMELTAARTAFTFSED